jgi:diguanylate cyclase
VLVLASVVLLPNALLPWAVLVAVLLLAVQYTISRNLGELSGELIAAHEQLLLDAQQSRSETEHLFEMTDMLQSADTNEDAGAVLEATSLRLLPTYAGALYVFNNSRDRLDLTKTWHCEGFEPPMALVPSNCWALKRGKVHRNDPAAGTLCCPHHSGAIVTIELPMIARGTIHGLLMFARLGEAPNAQQLQHIAHVGGALADAVSLALSNIALREKLRTQALRDPLTGLYNRRYMEDALERYLSMAERTGSSTSVVMIDLDHFKRLNDEHGHARGDAVLREVAAQLAGALRPSDVACRYGGEELLVILPSCSLDDAVLKAEILRSRVESLSETLGTAISASFGVASVPETSSSYGDVVAMADAALYSAKEPGRNCVKSAPQKDVRAPERARLAATAYG